jgi:hypothetical protein
MTTYQLDVHWKAQSSQFFTQKRERERERDREREREERERERERDSSLENIVQNKCLPTVKWKCKNVYVVH